VHTTKYRIYLSILALFLSNLIVSTVANSQGTDSMKNDEATKNNGSAIFTGSKHKLGPISTNL